MSLLQNIVSEYNQLLLRDLGFKDWKIWEPLITKISETLGVTSLGSWKLTETRENPGPEIVRALFLEWSKKMGGGYWNNLVTLKEIREFNPYSDYKVYQVYVKNIDDLLSELRGREVYYNHSRIQKIFDSKEYKNLQSLSLMKVKREE